MKLSHATLAFISGAVWFAVGLFLMQLGLQLLLNPAWQNAHASLPLLSFASPWVGGIAQATIFVIAVALAIGSLKGKLVLRKAAQRGVHYLRTLPNPASLHKIYQPKYYLLLAVMILLGLSMKYLGLPNDVRGAIDIAVGAALIQGAIEYFRLGFSLRKSQSQV